MLDLEIEEGNSFHLIVAVSSKDVSDNLQVDLSVNTVELLSFWYRGLHFCTCLMIVCPEQLSEDNNVSFLR
jgi:hypothetical protein